MDPDVNIFEEQVLAGERSLQPVQAWPLVLVPPLNRLHAVRIIMKRLAPARARVLAQIDLRGYDATRSLPKKHTSLASLLVYTTRNCSNGHPLQSEPTCGARYCTTARQDAPRLMTAVAHTTETRCLSSWAPLDRTPWLEAASQQAPQTSRVNHED